MFPIVQNDPISPGAAGSSKVVLKIHAIKALLRAVWEH
jgi:hypothetical protein